MAWSSRPFRAGGTGAALGMVLAGWALLSDPSAPGAAAMSASVLLGIASWLAGAQLARWRPWVPGVAVAAVVAVLVLLSLPDSLTSSPTAGPLGYANANGALLTAAVAGLLLSAAQAEAPRRGWLTVAAGVFALAAAAVDSLAALVSCLLLLLVVPSLRLRSRPVWQATGGLVLLATVTFVTVVGATASGGDTAVVERTVGSTRAALWSEAVDMAQQRPVRGVGAGAFARHSDIARENPDLSWAHSEPLQVLAELGAVGFVLAVLLTAWMVLVLGRATAVLAILALQPMVDYTLHFPLVLTLMGCLLGTCHVADLGQLRHSPDAAR